MALGMAPINQTNHPTSQPSQASTTNLSPNLATITIITHKSIGNLASITIINHKPIGNPASITSINHKPISTLASITSINHKPITASIFTPKKNEYGYR